MSDWLRTAAGWYAMRDGRAFIERRSTTGRRYTGRWYWRTRNGGGVADTLDEAKAAAERAVKGDEQ